jgi:hypothetical protein
MKEQSRKSKALNSVDYSRIEEHLSQSLEYQNVLKTVLVSNAVNGVKIEWLEPEWTWGVGDDGSLEVFTGSTLDLRMLDSYGPIRDKFVGLFKDTFKELYPEQDYLCNKGGLPFYEYKEFINKYIFYIRNEIANNLNKMLLEKAPIAEIKMRNRSNRLGYEIGESLAFIRKGEETIEELRIATPYAQKIVSREEASKIAIDVNRRFHTIKRNSHSKARSILDSISILYDLATYYPDEYKKMKLEPNKYSEFVVTTDDMAMLLEATGTSFSDRVNFLTPTVGDWWLQVCETLGEPNFKK